MYKPAVTPSTVPLGSPIAVLHALRRHKPAAAAFFIAMLAAVAVATLVMPRAYRSQTKLFLRLGRENATLDPTATLGQTPVVAVPATRENEINSVLEVIKSRVLLERVVDRVGPAVILGSADYDPAAVLPAPAGPSRVVDDRYRAVATLATKVEVEAVKRSNVIQISYEGRSPEAAQAVVGSLVEFYLEEHSRINRTPGSHKFLAEQTDRLRNELAAAEERLRVLKDETGIVAPESQRQILVDRIGRLENEIAGLQANALATAAETRSLRDKLADLSESVVLGTTRGLPNQALDTMRAQLYTLQLKELELKSKYPESHPEVVNAKQQTSSAATLLAKEEAARQQVTTGPNKARDDTELAAIRNEALAAALKVRIATLEGQLAEERERLKRFSSDMLRVAKLQREVELHDAQYRRFVDNLGRSEVDRALEAEKISNVSIVQPATFDVKPVRPILILNAAIGFLLACGGSTGLALLLDARSRRRSPVQPGPEPLNEILAARTGAVVQSS
ncbi:MAG: hypothetical protein U0791_20380 [Gemmataceae bacterium]